MFGQFIEWVKKLFGKMVASKVQNDMNESKQYKKEYEDTKTINFDMIFANALSNKAVTDSTITITDTNDAQSKRSEFIKNCMTTVWSNLKITVAQSLGKGGKFLVPYVNNGQVFVDTVDQDRVSISACNGSGKIVSLTIYAESIEYNEKTYDRWIDYTLNNGQLSIIQKVVERSGKIVPLSSVPCWEGILEEVQISNVQMLPVGFLKCPRDSRRENYHYGVKITYGAEDTIRQLRECMDQMEQEYSEKAVKVFADSTLFGKDDKVGSIFKLFSVGGSLDGKPFYELFDPAIRDSAYALRYNSLGSQLEKEVGTSAGILTRPENRGTTAYEIKSDNYDTFCLVSDIRKNIEECLDTVAYGIDIYAEAFGLTPSGALGDYKVTYDWDTSLIESSTEKFSQYSELESRGLISGARLNSYVTGQSMEDAQAEIDAVAKEQPKNTNRMLVPEDFEPDVG